MLVKIHRLESRKRKWLPLIVAIIMSVIAATTATTVIAASNIITTSVECGGETVTVSSFTSDPYDIIEKAGVELNHFDEVDLANFDSDSKNNSISVKKAFEVTIKAEGSEPVTYLVSGTVSDALEKAGVELTKKDIVNYPLDKEIDEDITVIVSKAIFVTLVADGKEKICKTSGGTVGEFLKKEKITLSSDDIINHKKTQKLKDSMKIRIKRVEYKEETETQTIAFETKQKKTDELYIGKSKIEKQGENGERINHYVCRYVDGKLKDRVLVFSKKTKEPADQIVLVGTKRYTNPITSSRVISEIAPPYTIELDSTGRPVHYKKLITGKATAYYGGGITATGQKAMPGRIAVNPRQIPYGTKMYIVSSDGKYVYGYCVASDTGGFARKGTAIADLYFHSYNDCIQFGRRNIEIYVLE